MDTSSFEIILPSIIGGLVGAALYYAVLKPAFLYWFNKYKDQ